MRVWTGLVATRRVLTSRGAARIRTGDGGFADLCLTTWLRRHGGGTACVAFPGPGERIHPILKPGEGQADLNSPWFGAIDSPRTRRPGRSGRQGPASRGEKSE